MLSMYSSSVISCSLQTVQGLEIAKTCANNVRATEGRALFSVNPFVFKIFTCSKPLKNGIIPLYAFSSLSLGVIQSSFILQSSDEPDKKRRSPTVNVAVVSSHFSVMVQYWIALFLDAPFEQNFTRQNYTVVICAVQSWCRYNST